VVGAPSARGDGRASLTVARVLRGAELPLLVARRPAERPWARVICAVGRSVAAPETLALAVRLARPAVERLTVLHAYHVPFEPMLRPDPEVVQRAQAHAAALARLASAEVGCVRTEVRRGEPGVELLRLAVRERADLVVLGTQGRSALSRLLLGSAAEWIVANAPCDVAVARPHRVALESLP
jgi:nucleotide-binding universal stress UspA family protein